MKQIGSTFGFQDAVKILKEGRTVTRQAWSRAGDVIIFIKTQYPDENSKMTKPYLYMEKIYKSEDMGSHDKFPIDLSAESIFAEDWVEVV